MRAEISVENAVPFLMHSGKEVKTRIGHGRKERVMDFPGMWGKIQRRNDASDEF